MRQVVASTSALGRVARAHSVAAIVKELAGKEGVRVLARACSVLGMLASKRWSRSRGLLIDDRVMKAFINLALSVSRPT